jgi:hypothetical protein
MTMKKFWTLSLALLLILSLVGCASEAASMDYAPKEEINMEAAETPMTPGMDMSSTQFQGQLPQGRKWIITVNMSAETEDINATLEQITQQAIQLGGYLESQSINNGSRKNNLPLRNASLTVRIPADKVHIFTQHVGEYANVVTSSQETRDVTTDYVDTESRLKALEVEQQRLMELMEQATSMSNLLEIEKRLTQVCYELENVASQLRSYDNLVDYATVYLRIEEVTEFTPPPVEEESLGEQMGNGFMNSLKAIGNFLLGLLVFVVSYLPFLIILAGIVVLTVILVRRHRRNHPEAERRNDPCFNPEHTQSPLPQVPRQSASRGNSPYQPSHFCARAGHSQLHTHIC